MSTQTIHDLFKDYKGGSLDSELEVVDMSNETIKLPKEMKIGYDDFFFNQYKKVEELLAKWHKNGDVTIDKV